MNPQFKNPGSAPDLPIPALRIFSVLNNVGDELRPLLSAQRRTIFAIFVVFEDVLGMFSFSCFKFVDFCCLYSVSFDDIKVDSSENTFMNVGHFGPVVFFSVSFRPNVLSSETFLC